MLKVLGPGLITGASDDDPSGIGTYASAGAAFGYSQLWCALLTFPMMAAVQYTCAKIGLVTNRGLAGVLRDNYSKALLYPAVIALTLANTLNAGVDLGAISAGIGLLVPVNRYILIPVITIVIVVVQIYGSYQFLVRIFKWLTLALFAYVGSAVLARPEARQVLIHTFVPEIHFDSAYIAMLVALLGTTISPYLFFWQATQEVEDRKTGICHGLKAKKQCDDQQLEMAGWDVNIGMLLSNVVMYFIILASAATLHRAGQTHIDTAEQAAEALRPLAGNAATILMALGLIGSGVLAVPILTASAAYALKDAFVLKGNLDSKPERAKSFYAIIAVSSLVGMAVNFVGVNPIQALVWTAVINGFLAPPLLVIIMIVANDKKIMKERTNGWLLNTLGWACTALMFAAAGAMVVSWL